MHSFSSFLLWFISEFADPKIKQPGAWMPYQQTAAVHFIETVSKRLCKIISWLWSRQCGKTECFANSIACLVLLIFFSICAPASVIAGVPYGKDMELQFPEGLRVGLFAPKDDNATRDFQRIQNILTRVARKLKWDIRVSNTERMIIYAAGLDGNPRQIFLMELHSAAPGANVESGTYDVLCYEEAQLIDGYMIEAKIEPMRAATRGSSIFIGTVDDVKSRFDEIQEFNKAYHPENHTEVPYEIPVAQNYQNGDYKIYTDKAIAKNGFDSPEFRQKFRLLRDYSKGMLLTEEEFISIHLPRENRWTELREPLPAGVFVVAFLDVASINDFSVLKIASVDTRDVILNDFSAPQKPKIIIRFEKTYGHAKYEDQFFEMKEDLKPFPILKKYSCIGIDTTGDRGDMQAYFEKDGWQVIPIVFTAGKKTTKTDDRTGEVTTGSKYTFCNDYKEQLSSKRFFVAADEPYMGSLDFYRALGQALPQDHPILPVSQEHKDYKYQATNCIVKKISDGLINIISDPGNKFAHDDKITADLGITHLALYYKPMNYNLLGSTKDRRSTADLKPESLRSAFASLQRIFS